MNFTINLIRFPGDLPINAKAPELSNTNTTAALLANAECSGEEKATEASVTEELMGRCLSYLIAIGFLSPPPNTSHSRPLPQAHLSKEHREALGMLGGRGAHVQGWRQGQKLGLSLPLCVKDCTIWPFARFLC